MRVKKPVLREYLESIIITAIIALFITTFIVQAFKIPTGSMEQNLLIGDHLLVNKFVFSGRGTGVIDWLPHKQIRRGDVIVFKYPFEPEKAYVKRVIGLPGDRVEVRGRRVYVNGELLKEDYTFFDQSVPDYYRELFGPRIVPKDSYFALGDNRDNSEDSRRWGFVPRDHIFGRALIIYWSYTSPRDEYQRTRWTDRLEQFLDLFGNFFSKTRWNRTFKIVR